MIELANDVRGYTFAVPLHVTGWKVCKMESRGRPTVVYGRDGLPLQLALDATADELRSEVAHPGRYRLDPLDASGQRVPSAPSAFVEIRAAAVARPEPPSQIEFLQQQVQALLSALVEVSRRNTELAQTVVSQFGNMMESAAVLVRAAGDVGLPTRAPVVKPEVVTPPRSKAAAPKSCQPAAAPLHALVAQVMPAIVAALGPPRPEAVPEAAESTRESPTLVPVRAEAEHPSLLTGGAHFDAVLAELSPPERKLACALAEELGPHRLAWLGELRTRPIADAIRHVRALLTPRAEVPVLEAAPPNVSTLPVTRRNDEMQPSLGSGLRNAVVWTAAKAMLSAPTRERVQPATRSGLFRWGADRRSAATGIAGAPLALLSRSMPSRLAADRARFVSVIAELSPPQRALALTLAAELRADHRRAWLRELATLPFGEAVAELRALVGSVSPEGRNPALPPPAEANSTPTRVGRGDSSPLAHSSGDGTQPAAVTLPPRTQSETQEPMRAPCLLPATSPEEADACAERCSPMPLPRNVAKRSPNAAGWPPCSQ